MLLLNPLNPCLNRSTQLGIQQILNISQNELLYPLVAEFGVYWFALNLYNI